MLSRERMNDGVSKQLFASVRRNRCMRYETSLANEQKVYSDQGSCIDRYISMPQIVTASKTDRAAAVY